MVSKKQSLAIGMIALILVVSATLFYYLFPHIWAGVVYPLKYQEHIVKYSKQFDIDPTFVAAVIYAESHYNPQAVSRVGARGLMQLMPATAQGISQQLGEDKMGDLFDPETNIRYGTFYIAQKYHDFDNSKEAALAAYNGGPAVGNRYVVSREAGIPNETKNFIKTVIVVQAKYVELYGQDLDSSIAVKLKLNQPTWFEKVFNVFKF